MKTFSTPLSEDLIARKNTSQTNVKVQLYNLCDGIRDKVELDTNVSSLDEYLYTHSYIKAQIVNYLKHRNGIEAVKLSYINKIFEPWNVSSFFQSAEFKQYINEDDNYKRVFEKYVGYSKSSTWIYYQSKYQSTFFDAKYSTINEIRTSAIDTICKLGVKYTHPAMTKTGWHKIQIRRTQDVWYIKKSQLVQALSEKIFNIDNDTTTLKYWESYQLYPVIIDDKIEIFDAKRVSLFCITLGYNSSHKYTVKLSKLAQSKRRKINTASAIMQYATEHEFIGKLVQKLQNDDETRIYVNKYLKELEKIYAEPIFKSMVQTTAAILSDIRIQNPTIFWNYPHVLGYFARKGSFEICTMNFTKGRGKLRLERKMFFGELRNRDAIKFHSVFAPSSCEKSIYEIAEWLIKNDCLSISTKTYNIDTLEYQYIAEGSVCASSDNFNTVPLKTYASDYFAQYFRTIHQTAEKVENGIKNGTVFTITDAQFEEKNLKKAYDQINAEYLFSYWQEQSMYFAKNKWTNVQGERKNIYTCSPVTTTLLDVAVSLNQSIIDSMPNDKEFIKKLAVENTNVYNELQQSKPLDVEIHYVYPRPLILHGPQKFDNPELTKQSEREYKQLVNSKYYDELVQEAKELVEKTKPTAISNDEDLKYIPPVKRFKTDEVEKRILKENEQFYDVLDEKEKDLIDRVEAKTTEKSVQAIMSVVDNSNIGTRVKDEEQYANQIDAMEQGILLEYEDDSRGGIQFDREATITILNRVGKWQQFPRKEYYSMCHDRMLPAYANQPVWENDDYVLEFGIDRSQCDIFNILSQNGYESAWQDVLVEKDIKDAWGNTIQLFRDTEGLDDKTVMDKFLVTQKYWLLDRTGIAQYTPYQENKVFHKTYLEKMPFWNTEAAKEKNSHMYEPIYYLFQRGENMVDYPNLHWDIKKASVQGTKEMLMWLLYRKRYFELEGIEPINFMLLSTRQLDAYLIWFEKFTNNEIFRRNFEKEIFSLRKYNCEAEFFKDILNKIDNKYTILPLHALTYTDYFQNSETFGQTVTKTFTPEQFHNIEKYINEWCGRYTKHNLWKSSKERLEVVYDSYIHSKPLYDYAEDLGQSKESIEKLHKLFDSIDAGYPLAMTMLLSKDDNYNDLQETDVPIQYRSICRIHNTYDPNSTFKCNVNRPFKWSPLSPWDVDNFDTLVENIQKTQVKIRQRRQHFVWFTNWKLYFWQFYIQILENPYICLSKIPYFYDESHTEPPEFRAMQAACYRLETKYRVDKKAYAKAKLYDDINHEIISEALNDYTTHENWLTAFGRGSDLVSKEFWDQFRKMTDVRALIKDKIEYFDKTYFNFETFTTQLFPRDIWRYMTLMLSHEKHFQWYHMTYHEKNRGIHFYKSIMAWETRDEWVLFDNWF